MSQRNKLLIKILSGRHDSNIMFAELCSLLNYLDFCERIKGSHHIFYRNDIQEILNIQENNGKAKNYQVAQVRDIIVKYNLGDDLYAQI